MIDPRLLKLAPRDNVAVLKRTLHAGERLSLDGEPTPAASTDLGLGHKIAIAPIPAGGAVVKLGVAIGMATVDIPAGAHVHLHNMRSCYGAASSTR